MRDGGGTRNVSRLAPSARTMALVLGLGLVLGACTTDGPGSGVNVKSLATELVYGIPPTPNPAPPANTDPVPQNPKPVQIEGDLGLDDDGPRPSPTIEPVEGGFDPCPTAPPTEFPEPASASVQGRPAEGEYLWKVDGEQEAPGIGRVPLPNFYSRDIRNVKDSEEGFRYTVVEKDLTFGSTDTVETTYEVRNAVEEDGIYLLKVVRENEDGDRRAFEPTPAVRLINLPVSIGDTVDSVGVDPQSFQALRNQGTVTGRKRVDACGEMVDSFLVDATQESVDPEGNQTQRNYDYGIATQLGGFIIFEHIATPCPNTDEEGKCTNEPRFQGDFFLGEKDPD